MWPPLTVATRVFDVSSVIFVLSLVIGLIATISIVWMGNVKEHHWDEQRQQSQEKIAGLEAETAKANAALAIAHADIAKANSEIADAKLRAAALEQETAEARLEQERLKGQLAWRRLTREQHDTIVAEIRLHATTGELNVDYPLGDTEAATFANEIVSTLKDAGITVGGANASVFMPSPPLGIILAQPGTERVAHPVAQALAAAHLSVTVQIESPQLKLIIGSKPSLF